MVNSDRGEAAAPLLALAEPGAEQAPGHTGEVAVCQHREAAFEREASARRIHIKRHGALLREEHNLNCGREENSARFHTPSWTPHGFRMFPNLYGRPATASQRNAGGH